LRVTLNANEIATGNWRRASGSELLTTIAFLPGRLEWAYSGLHDWQAMNTYI
jgi:hypothetical protein